MSKTVPVADLAANLAALLDDLAEKNEEIIITRGGQAVVPMEPIAARRRCALERFRGTVTILGDIVEPLGRDEVIVVDTHVPRVRRSSARDPSNATSRRTDRDS